MTYHLITEDTHEEFRGHFAKVMQRMYQLNSLGICYLIYNKKGWLHCKPQWLRDDWHRCRMLDAMAHD